MDALKAFSGWLNKKIHIQHWHWIALLLAIYDLFAVNFAYFFVLWIRFDCHISMIPEPFLAAISIIFPIYSAVCFVVFWLFRLYRTIWEYASFPELKRIVFATSIAALLQVVITLFVHRMPVSYYIGGAITQFCLIIGIRFSYRFVLLLRSQREAAGEPLSRVMVIGAGSAGEFILHDIARTPELHDKVCCIIDDNHNKWGRFLDGVPIVGGREDILSSVEKYRIDKIYVAIPSASAKTRRDILNICKETGCELKNLPGMYQFVNGEVHVSEMRDVAIESGFGSVATFNRVFREKKGCTPTQYRAIYGTY